MNLLAGFGTLRRQSELRPGLRERLELDQRQVASRVTDGDLRLDPELLEIVGVKLPIRDRSAVFFKMRESNADLREPLDDVIIRHDQSLLGINEDACGRSILRDDVNSRLENPLIDLLIGTRQGSG